MPVSKKRKIVSTKRSAFWPCGSCRKNCTAASIECEASKRWHHMSCEGLTLSEFNFFAEPTASYTCNDCFATELGNAPYLWALTRLRQVNMNDLNAFSTHTSLSVDILLRLDECWNHGEDTLNTIQMRHFLF